MGRHEQNETSAEARRRTRNKAGLVLLRLKSHVSYERSCDLSSPSLVYQSLLFYRYLDLGGYPNTYPSLY